MFVCSLQACISDEPRQGTDLLPGDSLPVFSVTLTDGSVISNKSLEGKRSLIVFFNTSCPDCQQELPVIQEIYDIIKDDDRFVCLAISRQEGEESVEEYWAANNFTIPVSPQLSRDIYNLFASSGIPRIFISDTTGIITFASSDVDMPDFQSLLNHLYQ